MTESRGFAGDLLVGCGAAEAHRAGVGVDAEEDVGRRSSIVS